MAFLKDGSFVWPQRGPLPEDRLREGVGLSLFSFAKAALPLPSTSGPTAS